MEIRLQSGNITASVQVRTTGEDTKATLLCSNPPPQNDQVLTDALQQPLGLPRLGNCIVPDDRVVLVVDPRTPMLAHVIAQVVEEMTSTAGAVRLVLLLPAETVEGTWKGLLDQLPVHVQSQLEVCIHDPEDETQRRYLASSAGGERIYLNHFLTDADLIVTIGTVAFDSLLGYRGTCSAMYPALSDRETIDRMRRQGHAELTPDEKRPLRDLANEIGWLLGTQFTVQVLANSDGRITFAACGLSDEVFPATREELNRRWRATMEEPVDLAVISVATSLPEMGWKELGTALQTAVRLVEPDGRIVVIADVPPPTTPGLEMLMRCQDPEDLIKPLRVDSVVDSVETLNLIEALSHARICLRSNLNEDVVDELGMIPVGSDRELQRLIDSAQHTIILPGANYAWIDR